MQTPDDQETRAKVLEHARNFAAGMRGCLGALIAIGVGIYIWLQLIPHIPQWLGFFAGAIVVIGPQIAAAHWHEKQKERNWMERERRQKRRRHGQT